MLVLLSCASLSSHGVPSIGAADVDDDDDDAIPDPPDLGYIDTNEKDIGYIKNDKDIRTWS